MAEIRDTLRMGCDQCDDYGMMLQSVSEREALEGKKTVVPCTRCDHRKSQYALTHPEEYVIIESPASTDTDDK